jgi:biotin synthase
MHLHSPKSFEEIAAIYNQPFNDLLEQAHQVHKQHFNSNEVEMCKLLSIKTGLCPEDCAYCPQSVKYSTDVKSHKLMDPAAILKEAKEAKQKGAQRFCMGSSWRNLPRHELEKICSVIREVKNLGMNTCVTLGMLTEEQASALKEAGLDYYNHNLDTSPEHYKNVITTRTYQERLDTISHVIKAGMSVCCGAIFGMGETERDRIEFLRQLTLLAKAPESIPLNQLVPFKGTPLENSPPVDPIEYIRIVATTRILFPSSMIRLAGGRMAMTAFLQAIAYFVGANSIFMENCLTTALPTLDEDHALFEKLGLSEKVCI